VLYRHFLIQHSHNVHHKQIGQAILLHSIDATLEDEISALQTSQVTTFMKLLKINPDNHTTTASYAAEMRDIISTRINQ
ncbi:uncharacterized protein VP01_14294g1, partial [Puccinia sorghi]